MSWCNLVFLSNPNLGEMLLAEHWQRWGKKKKKEEVFIVSNTSLALEQYKGNCFLVLFYFLHSVTSFFLKIFVKI